MSSPRLDSCQGKALGVLLLVFLAGAASGVLGTRAYLHATHDEGGSEPGLARLSPASHLIGHLREELDLDSRQVSQVQGILDQCIMNEADLLNQIKYIKADGRKRILLILTEPQREKFQSVLHQISIE